MPDEHGVLNWLHIGGLRITRETEQNDVEPIGPGWTPPKRRADGIDADRVGAWPGKRIFDSNLGPNRNGRNW